MNHVVLLPSQKNQIFDTIRELELDLFNFEWQVRWSQFLADTTVSQLIYKGTNFYYVFDMRQVRENEHYALFSPGADAIASEEYLGPWQAQLASARRWLSRLKREIHEPDLWAALAEYALPPGETIDPEIENRPFTVPEVARLTLGIGKMRQYLDEEFRGVDAALATVNEKLGYLCKAAERQGRKDWFHTCIGVLCTLAASLGLSPEQGRELWSLLRQAVSGIVKLLSP